MRGRGGEREGGVRIQSVDYSLLLLPLLPLLHLITLAVVLIIDWNLIAGH